MSRCSWHVVGCEQLAHLVSLSSRIWTRVESASNIGWFDFKCRFWEANYSPILLRVTATMRGTETIGPPECRLAEWSTDWGCSLEPNLLQAVMMNVWMASSDLFDCRLTCWSTIEVDLIEIPPRVVAIVEVGYNRLAYLTGNLAQWSVNLQLSFSSQGEILNSGSSLKTFQECCLRWQMTTDIKLKNLVLWCQMLKKEVINVEVATYILLWRTHSV